ncbi:MAG: 2-hydroxychromene-2-carboxylate isomerase, partial [Deltaproteobacteria bacterium]|nr:2-hydroxychromene-2-carboxylate isomerase [Deltaproteobacteria bacterium]
AFLQAAFFKAVNTNTDAGLRTVVENAGLSWQDAQSVIDNKDWEDELEENRLAMIGFGSWGVPSYRLFDSTGEVVLAVWGQDRLWLVAREIKRLLAEKQKA